MTPANDREEVKLIAPDNFFLYLPVFYADKENYFGLIPSSYDLSLEAPPDEGFRTDRAVFDRMIDTNRYYSDWFAIGDPTMMIGHQPNNGAKPVLVASIITNAAFWAIDHRKKLDNVSDLAQFDKIISYSEGTTAYNIARHISQYRNGLDHAELISTYDGYGDTIKAFAESDGNTVLTTPQINDIIRYEYNHSDASVDWS